MSKIKLALVDDRHDTLFLYEHTIKSYFRRENTPLELRVYQHAEGLLSDVLKCRFLPGVVLVDWILVEPTGLSRPIKNGIELAAILKQIIPVKVILWSAAESFPLNDRPDLVDLYIPKFRKSHQREAKTVYDFCIRTNTHNS